MNLERFNIYADSRCIGKTNKLYCDDGALVDASAAQPLYDVLRLIQIEGGLSQARYRQVTRALKNASGEPND